MNEVDESFAIPLLQTSLSKLEKWYKITIGISLGYGTLEVIIIEEKDVEPIEVTNGMW